MSLRINDEAPNFTAETTQGTINFHDWIGNGWAVLFSHPKDFTPVCTTELGYMAGLKPEFDKRNCKIIGLSVDPVDRPHALGEGHRGDPGAQRHLSDDRRSRAQGREALRHAAGRCRRRPRRAAPPRNNATVRSVFVIGPDKKIKAMLTYPMTHRAQFRRGPAHPRLGAADREAPDRDAGQLEAGRRRHHRRGRCRTRRRRSAIRAGSARRSRICATCRSRKADPSAGTGCRSGAARSRSEMPRSCSSSHRQAHNAQAVVRAEGSPPILVTHIATTPSDKAGLGFRSVPLVGPG